MCPDGPTHPKPTAQTPRTEEREVGAVPSAKGGIWVRCSCLHLEKTSCVGCVGSACPLEEKERRFGGRERGAGLGTGWRIGEQVPTDPTNSLQQGSPRLPPPAPRWPNPDTVIPGGISGCGAASSLLQPCGCPNPNPKLGTSWRGARSTAPMSRPPLWCSQHLPFPGEEKPRAEERVSAPSHTPAHN